MAQPVKYWYYNEDWSQWVSYVTVAARVTLLYMFLISSIVKLLIQQNAVDQSRNILT